MLALIAYLPACTDAGTLPMPHPTTHQPLATIAPPTDPITFPGEPLPDGDPGPEFPVKVKAAYTSLVLPVYNASYPAAISLQASMLYDGYHARLSAKLTITGPNPMHQTFFPEEKRTVVSFFDNHLAKSWSTYIGGPCGNVVVAEVEALTWWVGPGGWWLQEHSRPASDQRFQESCSPPPWGAAPGGGDPSGSGPCYTYWIHHYWYYPATNTYEYRYSEEIVTWCENEH